MNRRIYLIIIASVFVSVFGFYVSDASAACQLNSVAWAKQEAVVGEEVIFNTTGTDCGGWEVSFNVYEEDPGADDFITAVKAKFTTNPTSVVAKHTFTSADYTKGENESGSEEMIIEAVAGASKVQTQSALTLKEPVSGNCQLSTAQWRYGFKDQPIEGSPMDLVVNGTGCSNFLVNLEIKEQDVGLGDDSMGFVSAKFNSQGTQAIGKWTVDGSKDDDNLGSYIFYFEAAAGNSRVTSNTLQIPLRSKSGCLNCNAVTAPNPCECADGFTGDRGLGGTCDNVCKVHIGDAQGGTSGGGGSAVCGNGTCESGETQTSCSADCKPGQDQNYSFEIPNPLKGGATDLAGLVQIIAQWIFNLAIPIAVAMIVYAGILFLTSKGDTGQVTKAKDVLKYAVIGLAIILIGSGFVTLIQSVLKLGGTTPPPAGGLPGPLPPAGPGPAPVPGSGAVGNICSRDRDCFTGLKCKNTVCQYPQGNGLGYPCLSGGSNCAVGLACDAGNGMCFKFDGSSDFCSQAIDNRTMGTCVSQNLGQIGDSCTRDGSCEPGLRCNQICQRNGGNLNGEVCLNTSNPSNCQSRACHTVGTAIQGDCVPYSGT